MEVAKKQQSFSRWEDICAPVTTILEMSVTLSRSNLGFSQQACVNEINDAASRLLIISNFLGGKGRTLYASKDTPVYVLLIADHGLTGDIHKDLLTELGCDVVVAWGGVKALELLSPDYDLILLDIDLSELNGVELAGKLRRHLKERCPRIIATTSLLNESTIRACLEQGVEQVCLKPINLNGFKDILSFNSDRKENPLECFNS